MKFKTTNKAIRENGGLIIRLGYCEAQELLHYQSAGAYTCGVYGWNYDAYFINGATICTGYRGMPGARYEGITEYEKQAAKINHNYNISYEERRDAVNSLLYEYIEKCRAEWLGVQRCRTYC